MIDVRIAIVGGGMAGASAACLIAEEAGSGADIVVLERESQPGYHTTGRSAAMYTEVYGNDVIRALVRAGRGFMESPAERYADHPLLTPRGALMVANTGEAERLDAFMEEMQRPDVLSRVDAAHCKEICPALRQDQLSGGVHEPLAMDIDVHGMLQGFVRVFRGLGGRIIGDAAVTAIERGGDGFRIGTTAGEVRAEIVINAAGAWGDDLATMAGATPVGLVPKRRTAITFDPAAGTDVSTWPLTFELGGGWYFKPDAGRILASPADETPSAPCDAQPDEMDIAICVDRIQNATDLQVRRLASSWAGLRCFVDDHSPVNGFDDAVEGFYWLVGQGGYGIKTSPAMGRIAAAQIAGKPVPADILDQGLSIDSLSVNRFRGENG
ncbi:MAG: FAD-dependent catabolic D-arginine dehydrogenase DauA [Minwuia thermotolerans]|nr:MAG: FAD-dependent catabolic D-arginine dehydrogenase DauA [Minwuia thermotolerans]